MKKIIYALSLSAAISSPAFSQWDTIMTQAFHADQFSKVWAMDTMGGKIYAGMELGFVANLASSPDGNYGTWMIEPNYVPSLPGPDYYVTAIKTTAANQMFIGTQNLSNGATLTSFDGSSFATLTPPPFGGQPNDFIEIPKMVTYSPTGSNDTLYVAYNNNPGMGAEIWKTPLAAPGSSWTNALDLPPGINNIYDMETFNGSIFVSASDTNLWSSSDGVTWTLVTHAFGDNTNGRISSLEKHAGYLYAGTFNGANGFQIYRSSDGVTWTAVDLSGFGNAGNLNTVADMRSHNGSLWLSATGNIFLVPIQPTGGSGFTVMGGGFGPITYVSADGLNFTKDAANGFGSSNSYGDFGLAALRNKVFSFGKETGGMGAIVHQRCFNPVVSFTPSADTACGVIAMTNTTTGSESSSWFLDGSFASGSFTYNFGGGTPGTHEIKLMSFNGNCMSMDSVNVEILNPITGLTLGGNFIECTGNTMNLNIAHSGGMAPYSYNWVGSVNYTTQNVNHIAMFSEQYTITVSDNYGCSGTTMPVLTALPSTDISGTVTYSGGGLPSGNVFLIKIGTSSADYDTVATTAITAGAFTFSNPIAGNYYARAEAGGGFPLLVNTYYGNEYLWDSASAVPHGCSVIDSANIMMVELPGTTGPGSIHGTVYEGAGFGQKIILGPLSVMANVIPGVPVKVGKNPGGAIVAGTMTNASGQYDFNGLPYDSYKIYTDIPGYPMDSSYAVVLSASTDSLINLDYFVDSNSVYIDLTTQVQSFAANTAMLSVFPNPTTGSINIKLSNGNSNETIRLFDVSGRLVYTSKENSFQNNSVIHIDLNDCGISSGIYLLELQNVGKKVKINFTKNQ